MSPLPENRKAMGDVKLEKDEEYYLEACKQYRLNEVNQDFNTYKNYYPDAIKQQLQQAR